MKKVIVSLVLIVTVFILGACGQTKRPSSSAKQSVTLIIKTDKKTQKQTVSFKKGDTVMTVLKSKAKVEEKSGFITAINGIKQNPSAKKYWMYKVNGKLAPKMADQTKVKNGDTIIFYMDVMK